MKKYPSDVTESQWQVIKNIVDSEQRKRKYSLKDVLKIIVNDEVNSYWLVEMK